MNAGSNSKRINSLFSFSNSKYGGIFFKVIRSSDKLWKKINQIILFYYYQCYDIDIAFVVALKGILTILYCGANIYLWILVKRK